MIIKMKVILKKIKTFFVDYFNTIKIKFNKIENGINKDEKREKKIIVSLTTFPARIDTVYLTIKSLFLQNVKADKIILYLGDDLLNIKLPTNLTDLVEYGLTIEHRNGNLKSHKKYYYAIQEFPNDLIITVDDDLYYDRNFIKKLYDFHKEYPNQVCALRVHEIMFENEKIRPYRYWNFECDTIQKPSHKLFLTTGAGALFPPNVLPEVAFDKKKIMLLCPNADDVWINFMLLLNNKCVSWVPSTKQMPSVLINTQKHSLYKDNIGNGGNDYYINSLFEIYNINLYRIIYGIK